MGPELPMFIASCMIMVAFVLQLLGLCGKLKKCLSKGCLKYGIGEDEQEYFIDEHLGEYF
jgi:hypothetical protein